MFALGCRSLVVNGGKSAQHETKLLRSEQELQTEIAAVV